VPTSINIEGSNVDLEVLRPYQLKGVEWLLSNDRCILADDMGLGKTIQVIKSINLLIEEGSINKVLIVSPISLIKNWEEEFEKWYPEMDIYRVLSKDSNTSIIKALSKFHILITNYERLRTDSTIFEEFEFDLIVADEVHRVRNYNSQISKSFNKISSSKLWALTGTPIENNIEDLLNLADYISPGLFSKKDIKRNDLYIKEKIRPFILRRNKKQVLTELPELVENYVPVDLTNEQKKEYEKIWESRKSIANSEGSYFSVLSKLRNICDGGEEYFKNAKVNEALNIIKNTIPTDEKVIIFSYYKSPLKAVEAALLNEKISFQTILGDDDLTTREKNIEHFKNDPNIKILLASSRVAAEGLNLTVANNVIFLNRWWNPSSNNQARDRVNRMGQEKIVNIYNIYCVNTVEDRLNEILTEKGSLYEKMVDGLIDSIEDIPLDYLVEE